MDCGDSERLVLYAAGALDPGEEAEVADHLHRGCAGCEAQLAEAEILLAGLAMPEEPIDPPVGLKRRVLTRIGRLELEEAPGPDPINAAPETVAFGDRSGQPRAFGIMGRSHRLRKAAAPALAAAVAVVMTYGAMTFFADAPAERELRALRAEVRKMREAESQLARLSTIVDNWGTLVGTVASSAARIVPLEEVSGDGDVSGRFLIDPERRTGCLLISGLKPPERDGEAVYPVRLVTENNGARKLGALRVDSTGRGWLVGEFGSELNDAVRIDVGYRSDDSETGDSDRALLAGDFTQQ